MDKARSIIIISLFSLALQVNAQEVITGVMNNPSLSAAETRSKKNHAEKQCCAYTAIL
jgi:hypothetical protein